MSKKSTHSTTWDDEPAADVTAAPKEDETPTKVKCVCDLRPWHDSWFMLRDEEADVPAWIATAFVANGHCELVEPPAPLGKRHHA